MLTCCKLALSFALPCAETTITVILPRKGNRAPDRTDTVKRIQGPFVDAPPAAGRPPHR